MQVQDAIKAAMKLKGMTQGEVAEKLGTGQSNLSMQLRSGNGMRLEGLLRMANACDYDVVLVDRKNASNTYVIGDGDSVQLQPSQDDKELEDMIRRIVADELSKREL